MKKDFENTGMPRWLELQAEGDFVLFQLGLIKNQLKQPVSPIARMIDGATGYRENLEKQARELVDRMDQIIEEKDTLT